MTGTDDDQDGPSHDDLADDPPPQEPDHEADGLDLARSLSRSARGAPVGPAGRRRGGAPSRGSGRVRAGSAPLGRAGSGAHPGERDPQSVDDTLARLVSDHGWDDDLRTHGVFARWSEIVGADVGSHSRPESLSDGTLVVVTDSTAWATQLRLLAPALVRRLNSELGHGTVTVIDVRGPRVPSWSRGRRAVRGARGPRDTYG